MILIYPEQILTHIILTNLDDFRNILKNTKNNTNMKFSKKKRIKRKLKNKAIKAFSPKKKIFINKQLKKN